MFNELINCVCAVTDCVQITDPHMTPKDYKLQKIQLHGPHAVYHLYKAFQVRRLHINNMI